MEEFKEITVEDYKRRDDAIEGAKPLLAKVLKAQHYVSSRDRQLQENMAFYQGNPYLLAQYKENRPWVIQMSTPYASMAIDTRVASLAASDYIGQLQPYTPQEAEVVKELQALYADEWERSNMNLLIDEAIHNAAVVRESYVHVILDTEKTYGGRPGEITAYRLDTEAVLIDPRARNYRDAEYMVVTGRISYEEAIDTYPEFVDFFPKTTGISPQERGEKYLENDYTSEQEEILTVYTVYEKKRKAKKQVRIQKNVIIEDLLVESTELKGLHRFPVAQLRWKKAAQSAYGFGLMDDLLSLQKAICSIESAITNTAIAYANPTIVVRKGSGINPKIVAKTSGAPGIVYESDIPVSEALAVLTPGKIDDKIVTLKQDFENTIDKIAGVTSPFIGSIGTAGNTASGSQLAVERAKIIETAVLANISEFVEDLTMIFVDYIKVTFAGETITTRKKDVNTGQFSFQSKSIPNEIEKADFSFYIDLNTKTQYSKDREKEYILQIYQMERQYDAPIKLINELDILNKFDLSDKEELNDRYKTLMQQTTENKTMTIMKLQKAAQQYRVPEELLTAAIQEVIDGAKETPALDAFMQTAEQMATQVTQEAQLSEDELQQQGIRPEFVQQAKQMMQEQGETPNPDNLNISA